MCRNNDHGGRRCPASNNKAKRSAQNRAYYLAHRGADAPQSRGPFSKLAPVDALTAKLNLLPTADSLRDYFKRKAEFTTINSTVWSKDDGLLVFDGENSNPELEKEEQAHVDAISAALTNNFTHGDFEYKVAVSGIQLTSDEKNIWDKTEPMKALINGDLYDTSGNKMGYWERAIYFPENEPASAEYQYFKVYDRWQDHGIGRNAIKFFDKAMKKWGVETITVDANMDIGGYAWAKSGYDWDTRMFVRGSLPEEAEESAVLDRWNTQQLDICRNLRAAKNKLGDPDGSVERMIARLKMPYDAQTYPTPFEVANVGHSNATVPPDSSPSMWVGKQAMLKSSWYGIRKL